VPVRGAQRLTRYFVRARGGPGTTQLDLDNDARSNPLLTVGMRAWTQLIAGAQRYDGSVV
jgi:hypothetical protein